MFKNPSFLFDIICTAAWIILVVRYARKGFLSSIVQLVGNLFSLLGAKELSAACAGWVFEHMLAGGFRTQIAANIAAGGAVDLSGIAEKYAGFLPASFRASIVAACERSIGAVLADNAVECFDASGTQQWSQNLDTSPQALLANSKDLLLFSGNTVQKLEAPAE